MIYICRIQGTGSIKCPLAGYELFPYIADFVYTENGGFRPLAGYELFRSYWLTVTKASGFRPLAGYELFLLEYNSILTGIGFRPLAGYELFPYSKAYREKKKEERFRPLAGYELFPFADCHASISSAFSSPCGVRVVSLVSVDFETESRMFS